MVIPLPSNGQRIRTRKEQRSLHFLFLRLQLPNPFYKNKRERVNCSLLLCNFQVATITILEGQIKRPNTLAQIKHFRPPQKFPLLSGHLQRDPSKDHLLCPTC